MQKPSRIQVRRTKGWRLPETAIYVGRPTKWGNPYRVGKGAESREAAVEMFAQTFRKLPEDERRALLEPLRGRDLACWCPLDGACHADVLLAEANKD